MILIGGAFMIVSKRCIYEFCNVSSFTSTYSKTFFRFARVVEIFKLWRAVSI